MENVVPTGARTARCPGLLQTLGVDAAAQTLADVPFGQRTQHLTLPTAGRDNDSEFS